MRKFFVCVCLFVAVRARGLAPIPQMGPVACVQGDTALGDELEAVDPATGASSCVHSATLSLGFHSSTIHADCRPGGAVCGSLCCPPGFGCAVASQYCLDATCLARRVVNTTECDVSRDPPSFGRIFRAPGLVADAEATSLWQAHTMMDSRATGGGQAQTIAGDWTRRTLARAQREPHSRAQSRGRTWRRLGGSVAGFGRYLLRSACVLMRGVHLQIFAAAAYFIVFVVVVLLEGW